MPGFTVQSGLPFDFALITAPALMSMSFCVPATDAPLADSENWTGVVPPVDVTTAPTMVAPVVGRTHTPLWQVPPGQVVPLAAFE
jgi:hypothetical protein